MTDWLPIESAPRDGTEILVWGEDAMRVSWWTRGWFHGWATKPPTHWQPLPPPPEETGT